MPEKPGRGKKVTSYKEPLPGDDDDEDDDTPIDDNGDKVAGDGDEDEDDEEAEEYNTVAHSSQRWDGR